MDKLTEEELASLSLLLMSEYDENTELGLIILESKPSQIPFFYRELILLSTLHEKLSFHQQSKKLLLLHNDYNTVQKWTDSFILLLDSSSIITDSIALKKMIKAHEKIRPSLQVFLDKNSRFSLYYYPIARRLHFDIKAHFELAQTYYRICLKTNPNHENCLFCLAYLLADYEEFSTETIELYQRVLVLNPNANGAYNNIGHIYDKYYHDYKTAAEYYTKAHELVPKDSRYMRNLSKVILEIREDNYQERAKELLIMAIESEPSVLTNWKHLGDYYWSEEKEYELCKKTYLEGLRKDPKDSLLLSSLAEYYNTIANMHDIALMMYRKAVLNNPSNYSLVSIIDLLVNNFDLLDEAKTNYSTLLKKSSNHINIPKGISNKKWDCFLAAEKRLLEAYPYLVL